MKNDLFVCWLQKNQLKSFHVTVQCYALWLRGMESQESASFTEQGRGEGGAQGEGCLYAGLSPSAHPAIIMQQILGSWM